MRRKLAVISVLAASAAFPAGATGAEAVTDGGFEGVTCSGAGCVSPYGDEGRDKLNGGGGEGDRCVGGPSRDKATQSCEKSKTL